MREDISFDSCIPFDIRFNRAVSIDIQIVFQSTLGLRHFELRLLRRASPDLGGGGWIGAYQRACNVDAAIADGRVIQPLWLREAEESVA